MTTAKNGSLPSVSSWVTRFLPAIPRTAAGCWMPRAVSGGTRCSRRSMGYQVLAVNRDDDFALRASGFPRLGPEDGS